MSQRAGRQAIRSSRFQHIANRRRYARVVDAFRIAEVDAARFSVRERAGIRSVEFLACVAREKRIPARRRHRAGRYGSQRQQVNGTREKCSACGAVVHEG